MARKINKVKAEDMNEIKSVVNGNYNEVGNITNLNTTDKSSVVNAINELTPVVLYTNADGTVSTISTLSDSVANYTYIEIYYGWIGGSFGLLSTRVHRPTSTNVNLSTSVLNNSALYFADSQWTLSGTSITNTKGEYWRIQTNGTVTRATQNNVAIFKVIGYK